MRIKIRKTQNCYKAKNLKEISDILDKLRSRNANCCKLFFIAKNYYILSDKSIDTTNKINSNYIVGFLEEYATLISENAIKDIRNLL